MPQTGQPAADGTVSRREFLTTLVKEDVHKVAKWHDERPSAEQKRFIKGLDVLHKALKPRRAQQRAGSASNLKVAAQCNRSDPCLVRARSSETASGRQSIQRQLKRNRRQTQDANSLELWLEGRSVKSESTDAASIASFSNLSEVTETTVSSCCSETGGTMHQAQFRKHRRGLAVQRRCWRPLHQHLEGDMRKGVPNYGLPSSERLQTSYQEVYGEPEHCGVMTKHRFSGVIHEEQQQPVEEHLKDATASEKKGFAGMVRSLDYLRREHALKNSSVFKQDFDMQENMRFGEEMPKAHAVASSAAPSAKDDLHLKSVVSTPSSRPLSAVAAPPIAAPLPPTQLVTDDSPRRLPPDAPRTAQYMQLADASGASPRSSPTRSKRVRPTSAPAIGTAAQRSVAAVSAASRLQNLRQRPQSAVGPPGDRVVKEAALLAPAASLVEEGPVASTAKVIPAVLGAPQSNELIAFEALTAPQKASWSRPPTASAASRRPASAVSHPARASSSISRGSRPASAGHSSALASRSAKPSAASSRPSSAVPSLRSSSAAVGVVPPTEQQRCGNCAAAAIVQQRPASSCGASSCGSTRAPSSVGRPTSSQVHALGPNGARLVQHRTWACGPPACSAAAVPSPEIYTPGPATPAARAAGGASETRQSAVESSEADPVAELSVVASRRPVPRPTSAPAVSMPAQQLAVPPRIAASDAGGAVKPATSTLGKSRVKQVGQMLWIS